MVNIIINSACNNNCSFCFFPKGEESNKEMSLETFCDILDWLEHSYNGDSIEVGLLGGEPTLHSNFQLFIDELYERSMRTKVFVKLITNGANLEKYAIDVLKLEHSIVLNCTSDASEKICATLSGAGLNVVPALTVYEDDLALKIHRLCALDISQIRIAVSVNEKEGFQWFKKKKEEFISYCEIATSYNISVFSDCSKIPVCVYNEDDLSRLASCNIYRNEDNYLGAKCENACDIGIDGQIVGCLPLNGKFSDFSYFDFNNEAEMISYIRHISTLLADAKMQALPQCTNCMESKLKKCYAGCLAMGG